MSGHPVLLLPVTKTEPESLSSDETDISDSHVEGVSASGRRCSFAFVFSNVLVLLQEVHSSSFQEGAHSACATPAGRGAEVRFTTYFTRHNNPTQFDLF